MQYIPDQEDDKLAEEVKETAQQGAYKAAKEGVAEAKEEVAAEEDEKN